MPAAEIAAGAYIASEVIEHSAQAGYAAYLVTKPTLPLKATFTRIATAADDNTRYLCHIRESCSTDLTSNSLARSDHSVNVVGNKAYIFGGSTATGLLASNDVHAITLEHKGQPEMDYSLIPALPTIEGGPTPPSRTQHAACTFRESIAVYSGCDESGSLIDEKSSLWLFSPERKSWDVLAPSSSKQAPGPRQGAKLFAEERSVILFGGIDSSGSHASDLWIFDIATKTWSQLPTAPVATGNATLTKGQLYLIAGSDPTSGQLHHLDIFATADQRVWSSFTYPVNPMAPGPRARHDGALLPIHTGWGRNYLIYLFGAREVSSHTAVSVSSNASHAAGNAAQWSDTWVLQIPSSDLEAQPAWSLKEAIKPAKIKDAIRSAFGAETGHLAWAEAVVQDSSDKSVEEVDAGKAHPGPRAFFGADVMSDEYSIVFWGGVDAKGQRVGDGWIIKFE